MGRARSGRVGSGRVALGCNIARVVDRLLLPPTQLATFTIMQRARVPTAAKATVSYRIPYIWYEGYT